MVRHFSLPDDYEFEQGSEPESAVVPRIKDTASEELSNTEELAQAFVRFGRAHKRLGFKRLLALWVSHRRKLKLPVDDIDPEDTSPSESFARVLKRKFDEANLR